MLFSYVIAFTGNSLVGQRLGLSVFITRGSGLIPGKGTKILKTVWHFLSPLQITAFTELATFCALSKAVCGEDLSWLFPTPFSFFLSTMAVSWDVCVGALYPRQLQW